MSPNIPLAFPPRKWKWNSYGRTHVSARNAARQHARAVQGRHTGLPLRLLFIFSSPPRKMKMKFAASGQHRTARRANIARTGGPMCPPETLRPKRRAPENAAAHKRADTRVCPYVFYYNFVPPAKNKNKIRTGGPMCPPGTLRPKTKRAGTRPAPTSFIYIFVSRWNPVRANDYSPLRALYPFTNPAALMAGLGWFRLVNYFSRPDKQLEH